MRRAASLKAYQHYELAYQLWRPAHDREELNAMPAAYETQGGNKTNRGGGSTARKAEGGAAQLTELVDVLKVELADKMPVLIKTKAEVEEMMVVIAKDKEAASRLALEKGNAKSDRF